MPKIFVFSAGDIDSRRRLGQSVAEFVPFDVLLKAMPHEDAKELMASMPGQEGFYAIGAVARTNSGRTWVSAELGDIALIVVGKQYRYISTVVGKANNKNLAGEIWDTDVGKDAWEYIYFLSRPELVEMDVRQRPVAAFLNQSYLGHTQISDQKIREILNAYGDVRKFFQVEFGVEIPLPQQVTSDLPQESPYHLVIAKNRSVAEECAEPRTAYVWPSDDRWNDQGFRVLIQSLITGPTGQVAYRSQTSGALASSAFSDSREFIENFLGDRLIRSAREAHSYLGHEAIWFATVQGNLNEYRRMVELLGKVETRRALEAMHDVSALELRKDKPLWFDRAVGSEAFRLGVLRSTDRYFAYRRARDILTGNEKASLELERTSIRLKFKLTSFANEHEIEMDFSESSYFNRRINVLIGENGVGKSQTLSHLISAIAGERKRRAVLQPKGQFSRVLAFSGIPSQTSLPTQVENKRHLQYRFFPLSPQGRAGGGRRALTSALKDLLRDEVRIGGSRRIELLQGALSDWLDFSRICLPIKNGGGPVHGRVRRIDGMSYLSLDSVSAGEKIFLDQHSLINPDQTLVFLNEALDQAIPLSSGQELFFRFALNLCAFLEVGTLVLLDEPENHLHPNFVTRLMALLRDLLSATGSFAVVATHSPFVVREVTRKDVSILGRASNANVSVRRPRLQTLGANVAAVSAYVFGDETVPTLTRLTVDAMNRGEIPDPDDENFLAELAEDLSNEAISHVRASLYKLRSAGELS